MQNNTVAERLDLASGYRLGFHSILRPFLKEARIDIAPPTEDAITEAFVLIDDFDMRAQRDLMTLSASQTAPPAYLSNPPAPLQSCGRHRQAARQSSENLSRVAQHVAAGIGGGEGGRNAQPQSGNAPCAVDRGHGSRRLLRRGARVV